TGKRAQCFGGAKNHAIVMPDADMDQTVDALIGAGYGSAGERCMAISVAVPVGKPTADRLMEKLIPRVESLKIGTSIDPSADYGPLVTKAALDRVKVYVGMVGINVPIPVPIAYYTFGGWKKSGFGDLNQHGPDSIRFYTKTKTVTARWPSGVKEGAEFSIPTMN